MPVHRIFFKLGGVIPLFFLLVAGLMLGGSTLRGIEARQLARDGVETTATITRVTTSRQQSEDGLFLVTNATFEFQTQTQEPQTGSLRSRSRDLRPAWTVGETMAIRYSASDPSLYEFGAGSSRKRAGGLLWVGLAMLFGAAGWAAWTAWQAVAAQRTRIHGRAVQARLIPRPHRHGSARQRYFETAEGLRGSSRGLFGRHPSASEGSQIEVRIHGKQVWWAGDLFEEKSGR